MSELSSKFKLISAVTGGVLVGSVVTAGCENRFVSVNPSEDNGSKPPETNPSPESQIYPTKFTWLTSESEILKKVAENNNVPIGQVGGYEISIGNIISADGPREIKIQFTHVKDEFGKINSGMHTSLTPDGQLMYYQVVDKGDNIFVVQKGIDENGVGKTILEYPLNAPNMLAMGQGVDINFYPDEYIAGLLPALPEGESLTVHVPPHPNFNQTDAESFVPAFLVTDGSVQGEQVPETISPEFMAIQEKIASTGEIFTLNADGQIEMQTPEGMTVVPDIQVKPDGTMTFNYKGEEIVADPSTISIEGQIIKFADENGKEYRFTGEVIQERHDIEIRGTTYEGWLVEEGNREVTEGKETWVNTSKVRTDSNFKQDTLTIPAGYLTNYKKVEIVGGKDESLNIIIFTLRYFYKNGETLDVKFAGHNWVEKQISASKLIQSDRPVFLEVSTPSTGSVFSASIRERGKELHGYSDFELDFVLGGSGWIKSNELLAGLIYPQDNFWDLTDSVKVNSWTY